MSAFTRKTLQDAQLIRQQICKEYNLHERQADALPTLDDLINFAFTFGPELSASLMMEIISPEDLAWLNQDISKKPIDEIMSELTPEHPIELTQEQKNQWNVTNSLMAIVIQSAFSQPSAHEKNSQEQAALMEIELLADYEQFCRYAAASRNLPEGKKPLLARFLSNFLLMPTDEEVQSPSAKEQARKNKPRGKTLGD